MEMPLDGTLDGSIFATGDKNRSLLAGLSGLIGVDVIEPRRKSFGSISSPLSLSSWPSFNVAMLALRAATVLGVLVLGVEFGLGWPLSLSFSFSSVVMDNFAAAATEADGEVGENKVGPPVAPAGSCRWSEGCSPAGVPPRESIEGDRMARAEIEGGKGDGEDAGVPASAIAKLPM